MGWVKSRVFVVDSSVDIVGEVVYVSKLMWSEKVKGYNPKKYF